MPRVQETHHALLAVKHVVFTGIEISNAGLQLEKRTDSAALFHPFLLSGFGANS